MNTSKVFYLCPHCFYATELPDDSHEHALVRVDPGMPGDERRKPVTDAKGHILSPAPRWFHEAMVQAAMAKLNPPATNQPVRELYDISAQI